MSQVELGIPLMEQVLLFNSNPVTNDAATVSNICHNAVSDFLRAHSYILA